MYRFLLFSIGLGLVFGCSLDNAGNPLSTVLQPVPFHEVELQDDFWEPRLRTQKNVLVAFALEKTQPAVENLARTARYLQGDTTELPFPHRYISSDLYKVMEGAARTLQTNPDPALAARLDAIIDTIAAAQAADGYLYVAHLTGVSRDHAYWGGAGMGDKPYSHVLHSHEVYNMGHMYEAAIAYYQATGKDKWLRVAEKNARHLNRVFFKGDPNYNGGEPVRQAPGHQGIELALVKLHRVTGDTLYRNMARRFLDIRGVTYRPDGEGVMAATYAQQHAPVTEQTEAVGHAVRAGYMYAGMAEVDAVFATDTYREALDHIWHNIVDQKMHITGGLGAVKGIEGFGDAYELPNAEAYNETCAAVGNVLFNHRMFLRHRDARYLDVAEVALYNNVLAGVNLAGNRFFYVNPLESDGTTPFNAGQAGRSPWFNTACCPSNMARLVPQVPGMLYAHAGDTLYTLLYAGSHTTVPLTSTRVDITQTTNYPWEGRIQFDLHPQRTATFTLKLRLPTWAQGRQLLPGELYHYQQKGEASWRVLINGEQIEAKLSKGFVTLTRSWQAGDRVELILPMPVQYNRALDAVAADRGRLAVSRGPLIYCGEGVDHVVSVVHPDLQLAPQAGAPGISHLTDSPLRGMTGISVPASGPLDVLQLIPYYAWNNRGNTSMRVWWPVAAQ